jgi:hypothetical protein
MTNWANIAVYGAQGSAPCPAHIARCTACLRDLLGSHVGVVAASIAIQLVSLESFLTISLVRIVEEK